MKLWKHNRLDQEYELSTDELATGFLASQWADSPMMLEPALSLYIGSALESSFDPTVPSERKDFNEVVDEVLKRRRAHGVL